MAAVNNPALTAFSVLLAPELVLAQVLVRRLAMGFELRHVSDRETTADSLKLVAITELRALANHTATGAFRPLKAAPNLRTGWLCRVVSEAELESALSQLYPGAVPDWFAAQQPAPPVTHYRAFTARQTGMYRITTMLSDTQAASVIRACCDAQPNVVSLNAFIEVDARQPGQTGFVPDEFFVASELESIGVSLLGLLNDIVQKVDQEVSEAAHRSAPTRATALGVFTAMPVNLKSKPIPVWSKLHINTPLTDRKFHRVSPSIAPWAIVKIPTLNTAPGL